MNEETKKPTLKKAQRQLAAKLVAIGIFTTMAVAELYVISLPEAETLNLADAIGEFRGSKAMYVASATKGTGSTNSNS